MDVSGDGEAPPGMFGREEFHARPTKTGYHLSLAREASQAASGNRVPARYNPTDAIRRSCSPGAAVSLLSDADFAEGQLHRSSTTSPLGLTRGIRRMDE